MTIAHDKEDFMMVGSEQGGSDGMIVRRKRTPLPNSIFDQWSNKNSPTRDFIRPVSNFWVAQISFPDVEIVEMALCSSPIPNASRAAAQVGKFSAGGVGVVLEELLGLLVLVLRLLLLVSVVWQE